MPELSYAELRDYRPPAGFVAVSFDLPNAARVTTIAVSIDELDEWLQRIDRDPVWAPVKTDQEAYAALRAAIFDAVAELQPARYDAIEGLAVWLALHHPSNGAELRARYQTMCAGGLSPHFTFCRSVRNPVIVSTALGLAFADLRARVAAISAEISDRGAAVCRSCRASS
jgi:hypothetical protein